MSLEDLLSLNGIAFLQSAFQLILQRDIDVNGQKHYGARMRAGARKYDVISDLARSAEGRRSGAVVPGMKRYLRRQRLADMPLIGWIARKFYNFESNDTISRQIRGLQMQLATEGIGGGIGARLMPTGFLTGQSSGNGESFCSFSTHLALDLTRQDDLSAETIAIYALLKSPL
tara:strand:+ start:1551 stop:2069 length:519 start_codon:yes stop_codon:yes gene_type:complete